MGRLSAGQYGSVPVPTVADKETLPIQQTVRSEATPVSQWGRLENDALLFSRLFAPPPRARDLMVLGRVASNQRGAYLQAGAGIAASRRSFHDSARLALRVRG